MRRGLLLLPVVLLSACQPMQTSAPRTSVEETSATETERVFTLKNRDVVMTVTFPAAWEAMKVKEGDDLISRTDPKAAFGIAMYVPSLPTGTTPVDQPWRRGALLAIEDSLKKKSPGEYEWLGSEHPDVAGSPGLQTTVRQKDGSMIRDTYFFYDKYLLTATVVTESGSLQAAWPDAQKALQNILFDVTSAPSSPSA